MPKREKAKIMDAMQKSRMRTMETRVMTEMANEASIIDTVVRAHFDTCDYTADKIQPFINKAKAEQAFTHVAQGPGMVSRAIPSHPPAPPPASHNRSLGCTFVTCSGMLLPPAASGLLVKLTNGSPRSQVLWLKSEEARWC